MANTFTKMYLQLVFAVKNRECMIMEPLREKLQKYITGIVQRNKHKMLAIYCMPDHVHILIGLHPSQSVSDCARDIKSGSSKWINENKLIPFHFEWQEGYSGFTYSNSQVDRVCKYIQNQKEHHRKRSFREEYLEFLQKNEMDYDERYVFRFWDR